MDRRLSLVALSLGLFSGLASAGFAQLHENGPFDRSVRDCTRQTSAHHCVGGLRGANSQKLRDTLNWWIFVLLVVHLILTLVSAAMQLL